MTLWTNIHFQWWTVKPKYLWFVLSGLYWPIWKWIRSILILSTNLVNTSKPKYYSISKNKSVREITILWKKYSFYCTDLFWWIWIIRKFRFLEHFKGKVENSYCWMWFLVCWSMTIFIDFHSICMYVCTVIFFFKFGMSVLCIDSVLCNLKLICNCFFMSLGHHWFYALFYCILIICPILKNTRVKTNWICENIIFINF